MRTLALALLLAGTATPALSQDRDKSDDRRSERSERPQRADRADRADRPDRAERMEARSEAREARQQVRESRREQRAERQDAPVSQDTQVVQRQQFEGARERFRERARERGDGDFGGRSGGLAPRQREVRTIPDSSPAPVVTERARDGTITTQHRSRDGHRWSGDHRRWDRDRWRHDRRYDWRRWRDRNRSIFRIGFYIDPFGWGYRRWGIGSILYPRYYHSSYWIDDPWQYRLPPVYGPYRWVRYHNDALLIDTWSGQVVDVIYNFFW